MGCRAVAAAACVAVASLVAAPAPASPRVGLATCAQGYRYAGYAGRDGSDDVSATIAALSRPRGARGRGLAIVSDVARRSGGALQSAPSARGARLVIELPAAS